MAKPRKPISPAMFQPQINNVEFRARARALVAQIEGLQASTSVDPDFRTWRDRVLNLLELRFGRASSQWGQFSNISFEPSDMELLTFYPSRPRLNGPRFSEGLKHAKLTLEGFIEDLPEGEVGGSSEAPRVDSNVSRDPHVFLVHGHDTEMRKSVQLFLEQQRVPHTVLADCPNQGDTLIEKLEREARKATYAIILMAPEDEMLDGTKRPRQNVVLEFGWFAGLLTRKRVALMKKDGAQTPSDLDGLAHIGYSPSSPKWAIDLCRELKAAGFAVDANKITTT